MKYKCSKCKCIIEKELLQQGFKNTAQTIFLDFLPYDYWHWRTHYIAAGAPYIGTQTTVIVCGPVFEMTKEELIELNTIEEWEACLGIKL